MYNMYITSTSLPYVIENTQKILNCKVIAKEQLMNRKIINIPDALNSTLLLVGFYKAVLWKKIYKPFLDNFGKIIILFTGTDILHMCITYYGNNSGLNEYTQNEMLNYLKNNKKILFACENEYIGREVRELHDINCEILPLPHQCNSLKIIKSIPSRLDKICVYMPQKEEKQWYNHNLLVQVAQSMPDIKFYFYKKGGYELNTKEKEIRNLIAHDEVTDFSDFMKDKFCSIRMTIHDGEPLTGIETMILGRPFIFNFPMKYSEYCYPDKDSIIKKIRDIQSNFKINHKASEYYTKRSSSDSFKRTLDILYNTIGLMCTQTLIVNKPVGIYQTDLNLKANTIYYITCFGYSDSLTKIKCIGTGITVINNKYDTMNIFNSPSQVQLSSTHTGPCKVIIDSGNNNLFIDKILVHF